MLIACEIGILLCHKRFKIPHRSDVLMQKINKYLRYLIQFLDARYNNLWLFPLPKYTLSYQFNDTKNGYGSETCQCLKHASR